jgi:hypothetical protein
MLAINLFALHHAGSCVDSDKLMTFSDDQLSSDEQKVKHLVLDLMAGSLSVYLLPVYTLKEGDALLEYFALPASKYMACGHKYIGIVCQSSWCGECL